MGRGGAETKLQEPGTKWEAKHSPERGSWTSDGEEKKSGRIQD